MALDIVINKENLGKNAYLLIEEYSDEVRIAIMYDDISQHLIYLSKNEFAEICEKFLETK